jgi:nucleotide-binding universal stress UspA family protein
MPKYYDGPARVLVGYDGSQDSHAALRFAASEALAREADLIIVKAVDDIVFGSAWGVVIDPDELRRAAAEDIREAVALAQAEGVPLERIRTDVVSGNPAAQLAHLSERVSLVVMGRRSVAPGGKAFVGSTTVGLVGTTRSPVVVTGVGHRVPEHGWKRITVGVDMSRGRGRVALGWAFDVADQYESELRVLSIVRSGGGRWFRGPELSEAQVEQALEGTRRKVEAMVEPYADANPDVDASVEVVHGDARRELVARSAESDVLVIEVQSAFPSYAVGAIARGVMAHSSCPVGLVRAREIYAS